MMQRSKDNIGKLFPVWFSFSKLTKHVWGQFHHTHQRLGGHWHQSQPWLPKVTSYIVPRHTMWLYATCDHMRQFKTQIHQSFGRHNRLVDPRTRSKKHLQFALLCHCQLTKLILSRLLPESCDDVLIVYKLIGMSGQVMGTSRKHIWSLPKFRKLLCIMEFM